VRLVQIVSKFGEFTQYRIQKKRRWMKSSVLFKLEHIKDRTCMSIRKEDKELPEREGRGERDASFSFVQPQQHKHRRRRKTRKKDKATMFDVVV
jgi:hypothetical protein